jgi:hypothetical protein
MNDLTLITQRVKARYQGRIRTGFPTADIRKLAGDDQVLALLHGRLEMYLSGIAGYASSAERLGRRTEDDLQKARQFLSQPFFDRYPEYATLRAKITPQETPTLLCDMEAAEDNRQDLLREVERLLRSTGQPVAKK